MVIAVKYRILISCPGDVGQSFMPIITGAIDEYNRKLWTFSTVFEESYGYIPSFEIIYWVDNAVPVLEYGKSTQEVIDAQLVESIDGTIAFFYSRLGKETGNYPSGTVEEIEKTNQRKRPVSIICIRPDSIPQSLLGDGVQYRKLQEYIDSFNVEKKGYVAIVHPDKIQSTIERVLNNIVLEYYNSIGESIKSLLGKIK